MANQPSNVANMSTRVLHSGLYKSSTEFTLPKMASQLNVSAQDSGLATSLMRLADSGKLIRRDTRKGRYLVYCRPPDGPKLPKLVPSPCTGRAPINHYSR